MLSQGVFLSLGALAALVVSEPVRPDRRTLNLTAGVDIDLDEDPGIDADLGLSLGAQTYTEDPYPEDPLP